MLSNTGILTVNLSAIQSNWLATASRLKAGTECAAVVKADGYSLGALPIAKALYDVGCKTFYLATLEEATNLRFALPVDVVLYVLGGVQDGADEEFANHNLIPVLYSAAALERWVTFCHTEKMAYPCAVKMDTGMTRLGLSLSEVKTVFTQHHSNFFNPVLFMSHLACADDPGHALNAKQLDLFNLAINSIKPLFPNIKTSLANSSGTFLSDDYHFDMVRIGAALYGINPQPHLPNPLTPVLNLKLPVLQIRTTQADVSVGYKAAGVALAGTRMAVVAGGYADGVHRSLGFSPLGMINGMRVHAIGRISMDSLVFDITAIDAENLDYIEVINEQLDLNWLMEQTKTLGYEVLTSLGRRYKRRYITMDKTHG